MSNVSDVVGRIIRILYEPPRWLRPGEGIEFLVRTADDHDALIIEACHHDAEHRPLWYAVDTIHGHFLRFYQSHKGGLVTHLAELVRRLVANLEPKQCRYHDDCLAHPELADACWASTQPSSVAREDK